MKRHKRDKLMRAFNNGYRAGIRGHADLECPYQTSLEARGEWFGGWRRGRKHLIDGYTS